MFVTETNIHTPIITPQPIGFQRKSRFIAIQFQKQLSHNYD